MKRIIERILATTDGSPESEAVFPAMMPMVRAYAPEVGVLYVFEDPEDSFNPPVRVAKICAALRSAHINAYLELREGDPGEEILRTAKENKVDLIAMSTHGRGGVVRMIAGSVAEQVIRGAEVPVLITRPGIPVHQFKKIVVTLDGSERSEAVLPEATRLALKLGTPIELVRAALPIVVAGMGEPPVIVPPEDPMPYLKTVAQRIEAEGVKVSMIALEGGAASAILAYLQECDSPLLCMTTHGRTGLSRLLLGSVAEQVIRKAPCPVMLQRSVPARVDARDAGKETLKAR